MNQGEREADRAAIDAALKRLPPIEPPAGVVQRTLRAIEEGSVRRRRARRVGAMMLALAVVLLSVGLTLFVRRDDTTAGGDAPIALGPQARGESKNSPAAADPAPTVDETSRRETDLATAEDELDHGAVAGKFARGPAAAPSTPATITGEEDYRAREIVNGLDEQGELAAGNFRGNAGLGSDLPSGDALEVERLSGAKAPEPTSGTTAGFFQPTEEALALGDISGKGKDKEVLAGRYWESTVEDGKKVDPDAWGRDKDGDGTRALGWSGLVDGPRVATAPNGAEVWLDGQQLDGNGRSTTLMLPGYHATVITALDTTIVGGEGELPPEIAQKAAGQGQEVLFGKLSNLASEDSEHNGDDGLAPARGFIAAHGYFANTYVPGDSDVAQLDLSRVSDHIAGRVADGMPSLTMVRGVDQPFDRPVGQALSLQVSADRTAVDGPTRLTLQVGLAGAAAVKTRRAPLGVTLVIDTASAQSDDERRTLWSIAERFVAERQQGDAFALVVPGASGPTVLRGEALSAAEVGRVLAAAAEQPMPLDARAIQSAYELVRGASTTATTRAPTTLGASTVVIATAQPLSGDLMRGLEGRAHQEALGDVQLSLIGAGARVDRAGLARLAQEGQGRRWLATSADDARRVIGDELASAGRTVARALRLRIRLAPGVKLVEVLGSHPLVAADQARVKEAEVATDRKLADVTGIASDRGGDEDGIQIIIPAFMAGDDHTILLDVVVPGPGPVLDVHARWKDLVRMDNAEAQASLTLPNGADQASPLALNVVENRAAMIASEALFEAARHVAHNDAAGAAPRLANAKRQLDALSLRTRAVLDEAQLVARYQALLLQAPKWMQDEDARGEMVRALESTGRTLR